MTYFLRDNKNRTILDLEFWTNSVHETGESKYTYHEISVSVDIVNYSKFLLDNLDRAEEIVLMFDTLSEYRGWLWESYYIVKKNTGSKVEGNLIQQEISINLQKVAKEFGLYYVTD